MWNVFSSMFGTTWMTIDDVLVSVALLLITFAITKRLYVSFNVRMYVTARKRIMCPYYLYIVH